MNNTFYFLRHGKTKVDATIPISQWKLDDTGQQQAKQLATGNEFSKIDIIITSTEPKAIDTAQPIAEKLGLPIESEKDLSELNRDNGGFIPKEKYEEYAEKALTKREESINNWETASSALKRFTAVIERLNNQYNNKKILIVGHGYTINMYFAQQLNDLENIYKRLNTNDFADWGIIKEGKVIKDIAS